MPAALTKNNECHFCKHKRRLPGDAHSQCTNPDPLMTGVPHGVMSGWFFYPWNFDPIWKERLCNNFERKDDQ